jgi:RNA polymerase sigma-70 factor (ECF subfamily)
MKAGTDRHVRFAALMRSTQQGDQTAYALLLREITPIVRGAIWKRRGSMLQPSDVEDLVQDVLLSVHTARATYAPARPFMPWLMAIIHNRLADSARREFRRKGNEVLVETIPETFSPAGTNIKEEPYRDSEALRNAIHRLPKGQRESIELLKLRELSLKEASVESGMSIGALKVAVHRAIKSLRVTLRKSGT